MIKTVIIDDEFYAINSLKILLKENCPDITLIGEASSFIDAIKVINKLKPELIFLDIEMPGGTGFDIIENINLPDVNVIFVTAYNQHALKAFKFNAVHYLLKPVNPDELVEAVDRFKNIRTASNTTQKYKQTANFYKNVQAGKIALPCSDGIDFIDPDDIVLINAEGSYTKIITKCNSFLVSKYMKEIQDQLDQSQFFRSHNSHIVNLKYVNRFNSRENMIVLENGESVALVKNRKDDFLKLMQNANFRNLN